MTRDISSESDIDLDPDIQNMPFIYRTPTGQPGALTNEAIIPDANIEDCSCTFTGCTDPLASNTTMINYYDYWTWGI